MSERERLIAALHAHLDGETLSLTDAEDVIDLLEDDATGRDGAFIVLPAAEWEAQGVELLRLRAIVRALAECNEPMAKAYRDPAAFSGFCYHCLLCGARPSNDPDETVKHEPDCPWACAAIEGKP